MRLVASIGAILAASAVGAQTLGAYGMGYKPDFVKQSPAGEFFVGGLQRFNLSGEPLFSETTYSETGVRDVCFMPNGDFACAGYFSAMHSGGATIFMRRPDGSIRWDIRMTGSTSSQRIVVVGTDLYVLNTYYHNYPVVRKVTSNGVLVWTRSLSEFDIYGMFEDFKHVFFEGGPNGIYVGGTTKNGAVNTGYVLNRLRLESGTIAAKLVSTQAGSSTRFAMNGETIAVIQRRGTDIDVAAFNGHGVNGVMPELWRINPPDPFPGTTGTTIPAITATPGTGFAYTYHDSVSNAVVSKQILGEVALDGSPVWTTVTDSPNVNEELRYRALTADGSYVYATGSIKGIGGPVLYDRFLLSVRRRNDGSEVGWVEQGYVATPLSGKDICVGDGGIIGVALDHATNKNPRYVLATYYFAAPITLAGISLDRNILAGQNRTLGRVTLDRPAGASGINVGITSSTPNIVVSANLTIPPGSATSNFVVSTLPVAAISMETVSAQFGPTTLSTPLTLMPLVPSAFAFSPTPVIGGNTTSARLVINGVAGPGGLTVDISDNSAFATSPATVTVPAGSPQVIFDIPTLPVASSQYVTVTASVAAGFKTGLFVIRP